MALEKDTIKCSRCESDTPESELVSLSVNSHGVSNSGAWLVCGNCYDEI